jgi:DNA-binding NtrC family response regulator
VIGQSSRMVELLETARRAAGSSATVLLLGEIGTGKEVMARCIGGAHVLRNLLSSLTARLARE